MRTVLALVAVSVSRNILRYEIGLPSTGPGRSFQGNWFPWHFYEIMADEFLVLKFFREQPVALWTHDLRRQRFAEDVPSRFTLCAMTRGPVGVHYEETQCEGVKP